MIIKPAAWLNLWVQAPLDDPTLLNGSPVSLNISDLLNAWVQWEGLTDLGDWTVALRQRLRRNRPVQRQRQRPADLCVRLLYP